MPLSTIYEGTVYPSMKCHATIATRKNFTTPRLLKTIMICSFIMWLVGAVFTLYRWEMICGWSSASVQSHAASRSAVQSRQVCRPSPPNAKIRYIQDTRLSIRGTEALIFQRSMLRGLIDRKSWEWAEKELKKSQEKAKRERELRAKNRLKRQTITNTLQHRLCYMDKTVSILAHY